jgi:hypothetical protein
MQMINAVLSADPATGLELARRLGYGDAPQPVASVATFSTFRSQSSPPSFLRRAFS